MLSDNKTSVSSGNITEGIKEDNQARKKVIRFILSFLEEFKKRYENIKPEDGLTQKLTTLLDNKARMSLSICGFRQQPMENPDRGDSPRNDFDVRAISGLMIDAKKYEDDEPFMVFEAKRLDSKLPRNRKKEYVIGKHGGIERFKREIHGKKLNYVGMIGYMQTEDFKTWLEKINGYIDDEILSTSSKELLWEEKDKLYPDKQNTIYQTFKSKHTCISEKCIKMHHIWIDLIS